MTLNPVLLIPARMGSTRLPGKPLADINGKAMILHVVERALEANIGPVFVATDDTRISDIVTAAGFQAIMTNSCHQSGSDRIFEALQQIDKIGQFDTIINVQGDLPTINPQAIKSAIMPLKERIVDIATLCVAISLEEEKTNPNIVKLVGTPTDKRQLRALYFTRATAPYGHGPLYHHIGLYAYRREALARFVTLPPSPLETREKLEQLRAIEAGMRIDAEIIDDVPLGVDTHQDLARACQILANRNGENGQNQ